MNETLYIFDNAGTLYTMPPEYVYRNKQHPIQVSAEWFREVKDDWKSFHASVFTTGMPLSTKGLVCIGRREPGSPKFKILLWCVRFAVQSGTALFKRNFGESFLWPLSKSVALGLHMDIRTREDLEGVPDYLRSVLCTEFTPVYGRFGFSAEAWPACQRVERISCPYDRTFAMSVAPSTFLSTTPKELNFSRPDKFCEQTFDISNYPDDVNHLILKEVTTQLLKQGNVKQLMQMRCLSKAIKTEIDETAFNALFRLFDVLITAHKSNTMEDILRARDTILEYGVSPLHLAIEYTLLASKKLKPGILSFVRFHANKKPCEIVPTQAKFRVKRLANALKTHESIGRKIKMRRVL